MSNLQNPAYEALEQRMSLEGVELSNLASLSSRTSFDDHVETSDQHEPGTRTPSTDMVHRPSDISDVEIASQSHPLQPGGDTQESFDFPKALRGRTAVQKIGLQTVVILVASFILTAAVIGFLTFLWTAPHANSFWRVIVVKGWAGGAVTVSALMLRTAIGFQAGVAVAMLAAILLETDDSLLFADAAQVSKLRAGRAIPLDIAIPHIRSMRYEWPQSLGGYAQSVVVLLLVATTLVLQITSTMLVSDLSLGVLPSLPSSENLRFDFAYEWNQTDREWAYPLQPRAAKPWMRNPPAFPTFAEFSKPIDVPEHVDLLRAFLPFQDAQSRETISQYSGKALVLDARISCQRPQLQQLYIDRNHSSFSLAGAFSKTQDVHGLLGSASSVPFNCPYPDIFREHSTIICQPSGLRYHDGKLVSELRDGKQWSTLAESWSNGSLSIDDRPNAAFLIFNNTLGSHIGASTNNASNISTTSGHGAWTDVSHLPYTSGGSVFVNTSLTLCYPATWTARLNVAIHSPHNRTEPSASSFDPSFRTTPDIHVQMGEFHHEHEKATLESRGILSLAPKDSWVPDPADAVHYDISGAGNVTRSEFDSFIPKSAAIGGPIIYPGYLPVNDSLSWSFEPEFVASDENSLDITLASIFTTSLQITHGSAATALSTIITILASMAYYDQFPNFAETARDVSTTYFQPFLFPQSFRGFAAVLAITVSHVLLVLLIAAAFVTSTRLTTLGDHWQTIPQTISPATEDFLANSSCATDKEVCRGLKADGRDHEMVNLQVLAEDDGRVGLVARKSRQRSSHDTGLE